MSGDAIGAAISIGATVIMYAAVFTQIGPFAKDAGLETLWRALRAGLHDLAHRKDMARVSRGIRPYLTADQMEELEIECYVGPYAEPFRADSIRAYAIAKRRKQLKIRGVPACERAEEVSHVYAMNNRCVACGTYRGTIELTDEEFVAEMEARLGSIGVRLDAAMEKLGDCLGDRNRDVHHWRTFEGLEGFYAKCLRCGVRQEQTEIQPIPRLPNPGREATW